MDALNQLQDLKASAEKLSIQIQTCNLADDEFLIRSGFCKVRGKSLILLDRRLSPEQQIEVILEAFTHLDWELVYIPPWIRERLEETANRGNQK